MSIRTRTPLALPLLIASGLALAGCGQDLSGTPDMYRWSQAETTHDNKVDYVTLTHTVHFDPGATKLSAAESASLMRFFDENGLSYGDQVTVDTGPRLAGAQGTLADKRADTVAAVVHKLSVATETGKRTTDRGAVGHDNLLVALGRYVVTSPNCPDWRKPEPDDYTNSPPSNFGCATATNLGLMVANPADLVRGSAMGNADGEFASRGVEQYRKGAISKSLSPELSTSGGGAGGGGGGGGGQ